MWSQCDFVTIESIIIAIIDIFGTMHYCYNIIESSNVCCCCSKYGPRFIIHRRSKVKLQADSVEWRVVGEVCNITVSYYQTVIQWFLGLFLSSLNTIKWLARGRTWSLSRDVCNQSMHAAKSRTTLMLNDVATWRHCPALVVYTPAGNHTTTQRTIRPCDWRVIWWRHVPYDVTAGAPLRLSWLAEGRPWPVLPNTWRSVQVLGSVAY